MERHFGVVRGRYNDRYGVLIDLYTHPKTRFCVTSPLESVTQCFQFENMPSTSHQDPSASPVPFARGFKEVQGVDVLAGDSALHRFPAQQREGRALCSIRRATPGQSPPKCRTLDFFKRSRQIRGM